jgi:hypothetical protein
MSDPTRDEEYRACAERVAREVLGSPNRHLSDNGDLRWGTQGSMVLNLDRGVFYDHEANEGGGVRWLLITKLHLDEVSVDEWLAHRKYITVKGNGHSRSNQHKIAATYDYTDETGAILFQVVRFEPKEFRQRKPNGLGWTWSVKDVRQVPYRLLQLTEAIANERPVFITEGEKDCDSLAGWSVPATCNAGGAGKWRDELNKHFSGADVVLIPDNDDAGHRHVQIVGAALTGIAKRIRVLMLPGLAPKGDVSDWIASGSTVEQFWQLAEAAPDWVAPNEAAAAAAETAAKKAQAEADTQKLIDELARLDNLAYEQRRREEARQQGIRASALDNAVQRRREEISADRGPAPLFGHWVVEPWPEPVDGGELLQALERRIRRHVILNDEQTIGVALWDQMAWSHEEAAIHSPILLATSPEAGSGKTTLINLLGFLVPRSMPCVGIQEAPLFRSVELYGPTILIDEGDTAFVENEALRAIVNSGHTRGSGVPRCIGDNHTPHLFPTFCPKAIAMKGRKLPDTTLSRCIIIAMKRKKPLERAEHFRHIDDAHLRDLRRQSMRWSMDNIETLKTAEPQMPPGFDNRLGDNWRLMLAIADLAGGAWPKAARDAAIALSEVTEAASIGTQLLSDLRIIFQDKDAVDSCGNVLFACPRVASSELTSLLVETKSRPWAEWKNGKPLTEAGLARLLKPFGVVSQQKMIDGVRFSGYFRADFADAWERYLPAGS